MTRLHEVQMICACGSIDAIEAAAARRLDGENLAGVGQEIELR